MRCVLVQVAEQADNRKEPDGLAERQSGSHSRSLSQIQGRLLMSCCACYHAGMGTTPKDGWGPVPHKEPEGWQGSLGTASRAQLTGCCLAARSKRENVWLRCFPAGSLLKTAPGLSAGSCWKDLKPRGRAQDSHSVSPASRNEAHPGAGGQAGRACGTAQQSCLQWLSRERSL